MKKTLLILIALVALALISLRGCYGGGGDFPGVKPPTQALLPASSLEVVANLPTPPGNVAVSKDGRVFITLHPEAHPALKVVEIRDGKMVPYPSQEFQQEGSGKPFFRDVLSLRIDQQNRLWTLDTGFHGVHDVRLTAFDLATGAVVHEYNFARDIAGLGSHFNDFQISPDGNHIYIADASFFARTPAIVVYDVQKRTARRLLQGEDALLSKPYVPVVQGRRMSVFGLVDIRPGVDSIALDGAGEWLYFGSVTSPKLYRLPTALLNDASISNEQLVKHIETYADKPMTDGIAMDLDGNIYLTALEHAAIVRLGKDRKLVTLVQSDRLRWPDGFSFGPDGWLYLTCSSLNHVIGLPPSSIAANAPYQVFRIKLGAKAVPGH